MFNFRIIARVFSLLLIVEGLFMLISAGISFLYHEHATSSFIYSALITIVTGVIVFTPLRNEERVSGNREGYIIVTGIWIIFSLFGTLPFIFSGAVSSFGDAFFESMSGFTTTGATIMTNVDSLPHGILFWRSLTQWLGGLGIIFISLSIFPVVRSINIQIAATEFSGQQIEKIHPRIKDAARRLLLIYSAITITEAILLIAGGMPAFDAICHSFTTLSTGGFSTRNSGMAAFASPYIMTVLTVFMFLAGTNMALVYFALKGNFRKAAGNNEFVFYFWICVVFIFISSAVLFFKEDAPVGKAIGDGAFHVISIITTTGFYTQNYNLWGYGMILMIFILMFTGGTAGSTSGGIKMARHLVILKNIKNIFVKLNHPKAVSLIKLNGNVVSENTNISIISFVALYLFLFILGTLFVVANGADNITAASAVATCMAGIGPGMGTIGPMSNFAHMPDASKIALSILMILGRLEIITVFTLFTRTYWKK